jgi:hypothetical protein
MKKLLNNIYGSFNNIKGEGWAARKLTAFAFMVLVLYLHIKYVDKSNGVEVLIIDCLMILLLLGMVTFEQILLFKNGNKKPSDDTEG